MKFLMRNRDGSQEAVQILRKTSTRMTTIKKRSWGMTVALVHYMSELDKMKVVIIGQPGSAAKVGMSVGQDKLIGNW